MALTVGLLLVIVTFAHLSYSLLASSNVLLGPGSFSLADVLAGGNVTQSGYVYEVTTNVAITGSHKTQLQIDANAVLVNLTRGSILHIANLSLQGASPLALPPTVELNAARIRETYLPRLDTSSLLQFPWLKVSESSLLLLTGVELIVDCTQLLNLQLYMCAGGWVDDVMSNQTHIVLFEWSTHDITAVDVAITCPNASVKTCDIRTVQDEDSLRSNLDNLQPPLLVNIVVGKLTLADRGLWAHQFGPAVVHCNVIIQGSKKVPAQVDFDYRPNLFIITKPNTTLTLSDITLRGYPLGPPTVLNMIWMPTFNWWCTIVPSILPGPYILTYNVSGSSFEDLATAVYYAFGNFYSTNPVLRASAAWVSVLGGDAHTFIDDDDTNVLHANYSLGPRSLIRDFRGKPTKGFTCGLGAASNNYDIPLSQVWPAVNASHLLTQLRLGSVDRNFTYNAFGIILLGNVSLLDPDVALVLPLGGLWLYRSVSINTWRYTPTTIDFGYRDIVLKLALGVKVKLMNLVLMNLPSHKPLVDGGTPQLRTMMWGLGLWPISYARHASSSLQLENCTIVVDEAEANFLWYMNMRNRACVDAPCFQSNGSVAAIIGGSLAYLQTPVLEGMGYEVQNLSVATTPPFPMPLPPNATMPNHTSISPAMFLDAYGVSSSNLTSVEFARFSSGLEGWQLALLCIAIVLLLVTLGVISGLVYRFMYSSSHKTIDVSPKPHQTSRSTTLPQLQERSSACIYLDACPMADMVALEMAAAVSAMRHVGDAELIVGDRLYDGKHGNVCKGSWRGMEVALKTVLLHDKIMLHVACAEAAVLTTISHPNVVACYKYMMKDVQSGLSTSNSIDSAKRWSLCLVLEYCFGGSLDRMVDAGLLVVKSASAKQALQLVLMLGMDVARGLEHIHSNSIVHGNLKTSNVLLQPAGKKGAMQAKVGDFGMSHVLGDSRTHMSHVMQGTILYSSPELMMDGRLSKAADVYSFGVVLWELYHGTPPWRTRRCPGIVHSLELLNWAEHCPVAYASLARQCMDADPALRPTMTVCVSELETMYKGVISS